MTPTRLSDITAKLGGELVGEDTAVSGVAPAARARPDQITFLANPKYRQEAAESQAAAVIVSAKAAGHFPGRTLIIAADPYLYFAQTARLFHPVTAPRPGIHPSAVIEADAVVPPSCEIGANVYIGSGTVLGEGCRILANSVIEHGCTIGGGSVLHPNVTVYHGCTIGRRAEIHSGSIIGADGFGLAFAGDSWFKIPQSGAVVLGDDVEIGANTTVDRGAMSDTRIGTGCKIDNLVQIAHNCEIGEHTVIAACSGVSGSTKIGRYCVIGGGVRIIGHIEIADKTTIGGGTSITHGVKEEGGHYASFYPTQTHKEWVRNAVHIKKLHEMHQRIKDLEAAVLGQNKTADS